MWSQLQGQLKGYLSDVAEQLPQLHGQLKEQINQHLTPLFPALGSGSAEEVIVGSRRVRILRQLGEGGYSTVYLTEEVVPRSDRSLQTQHLGPRPGQFALKKILVDGTDRLSEANNEIKVMQQVQHPNLMPLLDFSIVPSSGARASATHIAYLLFPLYEISLWDYIQRRRRTGSLLKPAEVLDIFAQLCAALEAMHGATPGLAHRDVKPHNILLSTRRTRQERSGSCTSADSAHIVAVESQMRAPHMAPKAVLMDFGSVRPAKIHVTSRADALAVQEDAERHCSAPYRAPELWDVPSSCCIDERVDIWAAGCVLYYLMVGETPFERAANESGGSLMLAVVNGVYSWPRETSEKYSEGIRSIVRMCLQTQPDQRPTATGLVAAAEKILKFSG